MVVFLSLNVNGLNDAHSRSCLWNWLKQSCKNTFIACLQETHLTDDSALALLLKDTSYSFMASHGSRHSAGVAIIFPDCYNVTQTWSVNGRFLQIELSSPELTFRVCSVYAPNHNSDKIPFFEEIASFADIAVPTILAGDFNSVMNRSLDRSNQSGFVYRDSSSDLSNLFDSFGVVDQWRRLNPSTRGYTFFRPDGSSSSRIDLVGVPHSWSPLSPSSLILSCPYSDHSAVICNVRLPSAFQYGRGFWKLNTAVLEEVDYEDRICSFWAEWRTQKQLFSSILNWWDVGKLKIKELSLSYCTSRARKLRFQRSRLNDQINGFKTRIDNGDASLVPDYKRLLSSLAAMDAEEARGEMVRSRIQWAEEGERSSSFFAKLSKSQRSKTTINLIDDEALGKIDDQSGIRGAFGAFYKDLFTREPTDANLQTCLLRNIESCLSADERKSCEGLLSLGECLDALKGMSRNKSPGLDGLPMEFYLHFWATLGNDLVEVLNHSYENMSLSSSQSRGVITLVPKKGNLCLLKNWRPITLLNVDYKIASRAIAGRMLPVLSSVIATDQVANVPGRFVGDAVLNLQAAVDYISLNNLPAAFISLDQEKAFDRVDWGFMIRTMTKMGFGSSLCRWIRTFYSAPWSSVLVNGHFSDFFPLTRGVRQGCPLSPLLYIICAEVLAANVRCCPSIVGLVLPGSDKVFKITQYADDTTIIVTSEMSFRAIIKLYELFEKASGSKLNQAKSKGLWLGCWTGRSDRPLPLLWSSVHLYCLGVFIGPSLSAETNWSPRLEKVYKHFDIWQQRGLSLTGKAVSSNMSVLSGLWYIASMVPPSSGILRSINTSLFKFIWSGKKELVARNVMFRPKSEGGYAVVNPLWKVQALHIQWLRRFFSYPNHWCDIFSFFCRRYLGGSVVEILSTPGFYVFEDLPPIFASILESWALVGGSVVNGEASLPPLQGNLRTPVITCTTKLCYNLLMSSEPVSLKCQKKFQLMYGDLYWPTTWATIHRMPLDRVSSDLAWKTAHGVLYTADRLIYIGVLVDPHCFCGERESALHLFYECSLARSVLDKVERMFFSICPLCPVLRPRHILFGFSEVELEIVPPVFGYILLVAKLAIWLARNDFRFRDVQPSLISVCGTIRGRLDFMLCTYKKRFRSDTAKRKFQRSWGIIRRHLHSF